MKTQIRGSAPTRLTRDTCPRCDRSTEGLPFCTRDGHVVERPFTLGERYEVDELLGAGATAFVFGGRDKVLGRQVALKVLRPTGDVVEAHRFLRAARLASQIHHENVLIIHDCGEDAIHGVAYLVMERLHGCTLAEVLAQETRLPWQRVVPILVQLCRALAESHQRGILHRDLSPRNVTLTATSGRADVVKLCDFGLARSSTGDDRITSTGTAVGTPAYMAPEQILGDDGQDHRIDLYALGAIAYEMLAGCLPYEAASTVAMITAKLATPAVPLSERHLELPDGLEALIARCLELEPSKRPDSAIAIERELLVIGDSQPSATAVAGTELVGQCVGRYRVLRRLSQGGMGEVYLVEHEVIGTKAALKVLLPEVESNRETTDRLIQEARASTEIASPHVARSFDFGLLPDRRPYVMMELVDGESVASLLALRGPLPLPEVKQILQQICHALAAAHDIGIIHRDVKPANVMVTRRPEGVHVKVLDFGIAKVYRATSHTKVGEFMGTPSYCAPEQVLGEPVSPASDIYALGATAYELLAGVPPYAGEVGHVLAIKTKRDPVPIAQLLPSLPSVIAASVTRMMARDAIERPASMRAVAREIVQWPDHDTDAADVETERVPRTDRHGWIVAMTLAACVLVLATVATVYWLDTPDFGSRTSTTSRTTPREKTTSTSAPSASAKTTDTKAPPSATRAKVPTPTDSKKPTAAQPADATKPTATQRAKPTGAKKPNAAKPAGNRRPRSSQPPVTKPAPSPTDVLIVDPF